MPRLLGAALAALLVVPGAARAQEPKAGTPAAPTGQPQVDPQTQAAIDRAVEKAKQDLRDEVRAELQTAQSASEVMGDVGQGPKLEFLELDGYFRVRGQLLDNFDLDRQLDAAGFHIFPVPLGHSSGGTFATANMRLRLEPTMNVSEAVRVRAQIDVLDNYVLGSSTGPLFTNGYSPYPVPFYGTSRVLRPNDPTTDRAPIVPKRVWGEVETPLGLLSFGRMPSAWGRGILANAGEGIDDDYGDTVDRIQFALAAVDTPLGKLNLIPMLDFDSEGVINTDPHQGPGLGQPFDASNSDDARTYAVKLVRIDTEDQIRQALEAHRSSFNFGAYYNYRTQGWTYPQWQSSGLSGTYTTSGAGVKTGAYAHVLDLWARWISGKWRVEAEAVGIYGNVDHAYTYVPDPATLGATQTLKDLGSVSLRQWGGVLATSYQAASKVLLTGEFGIASGDSAPGFGNIPGQVVPGVNPGDAPTLPPYGSVEGPQFGQPGDHSIRNFRFNPAYRVDLILWRGILGQVTDAWYLRPGIRWDMLPGLTFDGAVIYSQAMYSQSTPSAIALGTTGSQPYQLKDAGKKPLGIEADGRLTLQTGTGFSIFGDGGVFQPFGGFGPGSTSRAWIFDFGLVAKF